MKTRFRLYRRHKGGRYYIHDETTGKQESLHTGAGLLPYGFSTPKTKR